MRKIISIYLGLIGLIILTGAALSHFRPRNFKVGDCIVLKGKTEQRVENLAKIVIIDKGYYYVSPINSLGIPLRVKIKKGREVFQKANCNKL
jgi:hypothetical protein